MPKGIQRDVLRKPAFVEDRFQISPRQVVDRHGTADLVRKNKIVIKPGLFRFQSMFVLFPAMLNKPEAQVFRDRQPPPALRGLQILEIITAAFAVELDRSAN